MGYAAPQGRTASRAGRPTSRDPAARAALASRPSVVRGLPDQAAASSAPHSRRLPGRRTTAVLCTDDASGRGGGGGRPGLPRWPGGPPPCSAPRGVPADCHRRHTRRRVRRSAAHPVRRRPPPGGRRAAAQPHRCGPDDRPAAPTSGGHPDPASQAAAGRTPAHGPVRLPRPGRPRLVCRHPQRLSGDGHLRRLQRPGRRGDRRRRAGGQPHGHVRPGEARRGPPTAACRCRCSATTACDTTART